MPFHRTYSITTLLAVAGAAALVALMMNRQVMQAQPRSAGRSSGSGPAERGAAAGGTRTSGLAAISPAAAAEAPDAGDFVRPAGPEAMRDAPRRDWDITDEASDESFPASDPPATY